MGIECGRRKAFFNFMSKSVLSNPGSLRCDPLHGLTFPPQVRPEGLLGGNAFPQLDKALVRSFLLDPVP